MEFSQIKRRVRGKSRISGGVSTILRSGLILENIRRMFLLSIWDTGTMYLNFDEKHSPNVLENQTRLQNSTDTTRKSLIFRELCALFENNSSGINRDILKHPTWSGAKNSNNLCAPSHLVTCFPRLKSQFVGGPNDCSKFMNRDRYFSTIWSMVRSVTMKLS